MADILIPDVPEDVIAAIDMKAQRLGLAMRARSRRAAYLSANFTTRPICSVAGQRV